MSQIKTGGQAFPSGERYRNGAGDLCGKSALNDGMTLRDYFAAKAMQAIITTCGDGKGGDFDYIEHILAKSAYLMADAMLAEREVRE